MNEKLALKVSALPTAAVALFAFSGAASAQSCDRACLLEQAKQFNANMLAHTTGKIQIDPSARVRENTKAIALADSRWSGSSKFAPKACTPTPSEKT